MDSNIPGSPFLDSNGVSDLVPLWPWLIFLGGAISCLGFSSISHLFACHSQTITIMIVCSFFTPIFYAFSEQPYRCFFYLSSITSIGIRVLVILFAPDLSSGRFCAFRASIFLSMGFSGTIPAIHAMILHWDQPQVHVSLAYEIAMEFLYATGAGFYVSRIPERWKPGAFDIIGQSHQIFHILVVAAALAHSGAYLPIIKW